MERGLCKDELKVTEFHKLIQQCKPIKTKNEKGQHVFGNALTPEAIHKIESIFQKTYDQIKRSADSKKFNDARKELGVFQ